LAELRVEIVPAERAASVSAVLNVDIVNWTTDDPAALRKLIEVPSPKGPE
jgi:hypothetical protein